MQAALVNATAPVQGKRAARCVFTRRIAALALVALASAACKKPERVMEGDVTVRSALDMRALEGCTSIVGSLTISAPGLTTLTGLESLTSTGGDLRIGPNDALANLDGLSGLTRVGGTLFIGGAARGSWPGGGGNPALTSIAGLRRLESIGRGLAIHDNTSLTGLAGLEGLKSVGTQRNMWIGSLSIKGNAALRDIEALKGLGSVESDIDIDGNKALTSLRGLDGQTENRGERGVYISDNKALAGLDGLGSLATVEHGLTVRLNPALETLEGLKSLTTVGTLDIGANQALTRLDGLQKLATVKRKLTIHDNRKLPECQADDLVSRIGKGAREEACDRCSGNERYGVTPGCEWRAR